MLNEEQEKTEENNQIFEVENPKEEKSPELEEQKDMNFFMQPPEEPKKQKKNPIKKIKEWWNKRNKKQKILIISGLVVLLIAIGVGIFFLVKTMHKEEEVIPPVDVIVQEENYRYENGTLIFLNSNKEEIGSYTCKNQNEELCFVSFNSTEDNFDIEKKVYENNAPVMTRTQIMKNNFVFINDNVRKEDNLITLYNIKEAKELETYQLVKKANTEDTVILKNTDGKYGVLAFTETETTNKMDFQFDYLGFTGNKENYYVSIQSGRNLIVDETGKSISKAINGEIKNLNKSYVKVKQPTGGYEVYNYNNQNVFNEVFEYVELYEDYAVLIQDGKMMLKFYDKNKLNEEAITLNNKEYVKTNVYDEDNVLKETKESFSIEENNNIITITIIKDTDKATVSVNKQEGNISKSLKNINYFDGKLYIYRDSAKTDLMGSYTCANKNNVSANTLSNCSLATDTVFEDNDYEIPGTPGVIPVLNDRFVFISDNPELVNDSNKTIVLYDLKKGSSLGKYAEVNTYSYTGTNEITFSTVNELKVVAKNQSGKFGVIKINQNDVTGHISFNYSEMESLRDYYVAKDANGYLLLSKSNGSSITSAIPYKIRNYNTEYVKVINNGNYYVYNLKGKQITEDSYKYIELYNHCFAAVTSNNKLKLFTYDSPEKNVLEPKDIQLNSTKYYGNGTLAFKINENGYRYEVLIGSDANTYIPVTSGEIEHKER